MTIGLVGRWEKALTTAGVLGFVGLVAVGTAIAAEDAPAHSQAPASENITFNLATTTGSRITSAELSGKPTILWFWAPWCPYSQDIANDVAAEAKRAGDSVRFVGIGGQDSARALRKFVSAYKVGAIVHGADLTGEVADRFGITSVPSFVALYPEVGYAVADWVASGDDLHELVADLTG